MRLRPMTMILFMMVATPGLADELVKSGSELQVNTYTTGRQGFPAVAVGPSGQFVIAWEGDGNQDGDDWGIFAQVYNADGTMAGIEFQVNTTTTDYQVNPAVAVDGQGHFVVAWQSYADVALSYDVFAQRFDSAGMAIGTEFQANSFDAGYQGNTAVAANPAGEFLIVWESATQDQSDLGVYGQLYDFAGLEVGSEFRLNDTTAADQNDASVVAVDGGFAATWESFLQDGSDEATILRFFDSSAAPAGGEIIVNTETLADQEDSAIAVAADGTLAVVWEASAQDGFGEGIFSQVFDSDGSAVGIEMQLNTYTSQDQKNPRVAADGSGGFIAIWTSELQFDGTSEDVFGQRFDATGALLGAEFQVNTQSTDDQDVPAIAGGVNQQVMVAWRSFGAHDGSSAGVFAQRLEIALFVDGFETGDTAAWTNAMP